MSASVAQQGALIKYIVSLKQIEAEQQTRASKFGQFH